jgi:Concanavalin A-like lectin/glucanases superfamily
MSNLSNVLVPTLLSVAIFACGDTKSANPDAPISGIDAVQLDAQRIDAAPVLPDAPPSNRGSLVFDGAGDFAQIPGTAAISTLSTITVEAWVKPLGTTSMRILTKPLAVGSQIRLDRESDGRLFGETWGIGSGTRPTTNTLATLAAGTWSHVALTFNRDTLLIYVNGMLVGSSQSAQMSTTLNDYFVGKSLDRTASFNGAIDELRIWNVARSQAQLQLNRSVLLQGNEANLVGYWNFDEGTGDQIHDKTLGNNTGRLGDSVGTDASDPAWSPDKPF